MFACNLQNVTVISILNLDNMKKSLAFLPLGISNQCYNHECYGDMHHTFIHSGIGLGSVIAVVLSWERNKSVLWAILHGIFGWFYVIYYVITRRRNEGK